MTAYGEAALFAGRSSVIPGRLHRTNGYLTAERVPRRCTSLAGPDVEPSRADAPDGNCHLLPALDVTRDSLTALAEVIEPCAVLIGGG